MSDSIDHAETVTECHEAPDVAELRRLAENATPGPWDYYRPHPNYQAYEVDRVMSGGYLGEAVAVAEGVHAEMNAAFITAANPAAVLGLLDEADALRAELAHMREARDNARTEVERLTARAERVRALHYAADNDVTRTPVCETCHGKAGVHECGCWASEDRQPVCGHCNEGDKGISVAWPCPTLRILDGGVES